ncbi:MAG: YajQ family cyclic di-GMP-binding protein [Gammaproteobacteria bacterium]|nr:YajQ family cyclic di-GMP-binding protein [Gammaproteobacteria bacterium]
MPSFDVVSEIDKHELANAIDQVTREIGTRYDFKGSCAKIEHSDKKLTLWADNDFQLGQIRDILYNKMAKRGLEVGSLESGKTQSMGINKSQQIITVREGVDKELGKKIVKLVKDKKLKVQAAIQGEQVRITGKKRDDLQEVIAMLRSEDLGMPVQFTNFRD